MKVKFSPEFYELYKKANVRIQNEIERIIKIFEKDPLNSELKNHELRDEYNGLRSINITADYRAIYEELPEAENEDNTAYFLFFGTHRQLYKTEKFKVKVKFKRQKT